MKTERTISNLDILRQTGVFHRRHRGFEGLMTSPTKQSSRREKREKGTGIKNNPSVLFFVFAAKRQDGNLPSSRRKPESRVTWKHSMTPGYRGRAAV
jgi:hypothetical protein